jgi:hypothetical protein
MWEDGGGGGKAEDTMFGFLVIILTINTTYIYKSK